VRHSGGGACGTIRVDTTAGKAVFIRVGLHPVTSAGRHLNRG
jgi:hypothetical protein